LTSSLGRRLKDPNERLALRPRRADLGRKTWAVWKFASMKPVRDGVPSNQQFDEIRVYEGVAERTGTKIDRQTIRRSPTACRSVSELTRRVRRLGDGLFYLPVSMWPEGKTEIPLSQTWTTMS
jgi:hypothetical protein